MPFKRKFQTGNVILWRSTYWVVSKPGSAQLTAVNLAAPVKKVISALDEHPVFMGTNVKDFFLELINNNFD